MERALSSSKRNQNGEVTFDALDKPSTDTGMGPVLVMCTSVASSFARLPSSFHAPYVDHLSFNLCRWTFLMGKRNAGSLGRGSLLPRTRVCLVVVFILFMFIVFPRALSWCEIAKWYDVEASRILNHFKRLPVR